MNKILKALECIVGTHRYSPRPEPMTSLVTGKCAIEPCELSAEVNVRTEIRIGYVRRVPESAVSYAKEEAYRNIKSQIYGDIIYELGYVSHLINKLEDYNARTELQERLTYIQELMS